jgi:small subunit ribosomal protein S21
MSHVTEVSWRGERCPISVDEAVGRHMGRGHDGRFATPDGPGVLGAAPQARSLPRPGHLPGLTRNCPSVLLLSYSCAWHERPPRGRKVAIVRIEVFDNQIEPALKSLKREMLKGGVFKEMKRRAYYEKPSVKRKRKQAEAQRKRLKAARRSRPPVD